MDRHLAYLPLIIFSVALATVLVVVLVTRSHSPTTDPNSTLETTDDDLDTTRTPIENTVIVNYPVNTVVVEPVAYLPPQNSYAPSHQHSHPHSHYSHPKTSLGPVPMDTLHEGKELLYYGKGDPKKFPPIKSEFTKVGLLVTTNPNEDTILELYRRPIVPHHQIWEYQVHARGTELKLPQTFLENGDIIDKIFGLESKGSWEVRMNSPYVWVKN